jgi:hypothetical protein
LERQVQVFEELVKFTALSDFAVGYIQHKKRSLYQSLISVAVPPLVAMNHVVSYDSDALNKPTTISRVFPVEPINTVAFGHYSSLSSLIKKPASLACISHPFEEPIGQAIGKCSPSWFRIAFSTEASNFHGIFKPSKNDKEIICRPR